MKTLPCKICNEIASQHFTEKVLNKHSVAYFHCKGCNSLFTEAPYWLEEAYENAISELDTGVLMRNLQFSSFLEPILHLHPPLNGNSLDVSGGYGLFARRMRDLGFNFYSTDPYCENLFAKYFEPDDSFKASTLTLFEVLEHLEDPVSFLKENIEKYEADTLIASTQTFKGDIPEKDWWYYMFDTGQHIRFYSDKTMETLSEKLGMRHINLGNSLHFFTTRKISRKLRQYLEKPHKKEKIAHELKELHKGESLTFSDLLYIRDITIGSK